MDWFFCNINTIMTSLYIWSRKPETLTKLYRSPIFVFASHVPVLFFCCCCCCCCCFKIWEQQNHFRTSIRDIYCCYCYITIIVTFIYCTDCYYVPGAHWFVFVLLLRRDNSRFDIIFSWFRGWTTDHFTNGERKFWFLYFDTAQGSLVRLKEDSVIQDGLELLHCRLDKEHVYLLCLSILKFTIYFCFRPAVVLSLVFFCIQLLLSKYVFLVDRNATFNRYARHEGTGTPDMKGNTVSSRMIAIPRLLVPPLIDPCPFNKSAWHNCHPIPLTSHE